jgi:hypothetical protein
VNVVACSLACVSFRLLPACVAVRHVDGKTRLVLSVDQDGFLSLVMRERDHDTNAFLPVSKGISKAERSAYSYNSPRPLCRDVRET